MSTVATSAAGSGLPARCLRTIGLENSTDFLASVPSSDGDIEGFSNRLLYQCMM